MQTKHVWRLSQVVPLAAGIFAISALPSRASELLPPLEPDVTDAPLTLSTESTPLTALSTPTDANETGPTDSDPVEASAASIAHLTDESNPVPLDTEKTISVASTIVLQPWTEHETPTTQVSSLSISEAMPPEEGTPESELDSAIARSSISSLSELSAIEPGSSGVREDLGGSQSIQLSVSTPIDAATTHTLVNPSGIQLSPLPLANLVSVDYEHWQIAQSEPSPAEGSVEAQSEPEESPSSPRWHFTLSPYAFVPLSVNGSVTVRDYTADFNIGLDDILDRLNFAAAGRLEAWRGNVGLILDAAYFNLNQENSRTLNTPDCFSDIFPSEISTDVTVKFGQFDLGVGYRFADNASNAETEFDLGRLVFDAVAGIRIYTFAPEIDVSTNLGTGRNLSQNDTLVTPLISGRFRWNVSPTLAGWARADLAGLGLSGTLMAASVTAGIDWMFSGNTSLLLAYRLSSIQYRTTVGDEDLNLNMFMQGPYVGVSFRF